MFRLCLATGLILLLASITTAQDLIAIRADQVNRLKNYVVDAIQPSGLVRDSLVINGGSFHPATPDAAGFALLALSALDHWDNVHGTALLPNAEERVVDILTAHAGQKPGVNPARSADGHFTHNMNISTGAVQGGGWDASYSPISTALLVSGAQFARNHFPNNATIASLANQLTSSVNFNAAIHPSLNGGIYRDMTQAGGGNPGAVTFPWNEYMLVESLALRETNNTRALAVKDLWLDVDNILKRSHPNAGNIQTLTDNPSNFAPAFWVQQMHFFNGDFRHSADFETYFENQKLADKLYSSGALGQPYRYGLTAGVSPFGGYEVDRILDHTGVFSPEAVAAWGDMDTLLQFHDAQAHPPNDPRYKYGMLRVAASNPSLTPNDAGLVDHLFLLFGLVESIDPNFFPDRVFGATPGDYNRDGVVNNGDYFRWQSTFGSSSAGADGNQNGGVDAADYVLWRKLEGPFGSGDTTNVPEPATIILVVALTFAAIVARVPLTRSPQA